MLFEGKPVAEALASLLAREPRPEEESGAACLSCDAIRSSAAG